MALRQSVDSGITEHVRHSVTSTAIHEPLLQRIRAEEDDVVSHRTAQSDRLLALPQWSSLRSQKTQSKYTLSRKSSFITMKASHYLKNGIECFLAVWSLYTAGRYLYAFTVYASLTGQLVAISLGICAGLSFALAMCAFILSWLQTTLLLHGVAIRSIFFARSLLRYASSTCLLIPSVLNIALPFIWKNTSDVELTPKYRCQLDIDLVWSTTRIPCLFRELGWLSWVIAAAIRCAITVGVIVAYHLILQFPQFSLTQRAVSTTSQEKRTSTPAPPSHTYQVHLQTSTGPLQRSLVVPRQSNTSLVSASSTANSNPSPRNRRVRASGPPSYNTADYIPPPSLPDPSPTSSDREFGSFVDRFRALISQITRETEEGLAYARSVGSDSRTGSQRSRETAESKITDVEEGDEKDEEEDEGRPARSVTNPVLQNGYHRTALQEDDDSDDEDEFYRAPPVVEPATSTTYGADEHIRVMNGFIQRMPTIESMGSRELAGAGSVRSAGTAPPGSPQFPRPPTSLSVGSWSFSDDSESAALGDSLGARAEAMMTTPKKTQVNEVGELASVRHIGVAPALVPARDGASSPPLPLSGAPYHDSTGGSRATEESYHTATTGSSVVSLRRALADAVADESSFPMPPGSQSQDPDSLKVLTESRTVRLG